MIVKQDLIVAIHAYLQRYPNDRHALQTLDFVTNTECFWQNDNPQGHITASAWVVNTDQTQALLTHHRKLAQWFQLGGHVEAHDADIFAAALREAHEESGLSAISLLSDAIFDIDVHLIPTSKTGFPAHLHYDIRVLLVANDQEQVSFQVAESNAVRWIALSEISAFTKSESVLRMAGKE
jgi:8-oxo-dGTP pyrophosphatase MutT (NUDIX family)